MATIRMPAEHDASPGEPPAAGLAQRSLGALKWNYLGTLAKVGSQFIIGILLARLLGPEPFGVVAIAWLLLGLGNLVADFGLAAALIQKPQVSSRDIRHVFTLQMLAGIALTLVTLVAAPSIATFFGHAEVTPVLRWMSLVFVIQSFGQTATALLRRNLDHKRVQVLQVASYLAAYLLLGVPLAFSGAGVWALVVAQLTQAGLCSLAAYLSVRHSVLPALTADQSGLFGFGSKVLISNLTSWGYSSLDSAIVGRMLGVVELGLYNRSLNLVASPMNAAVSTLQGVLFPLYSRLQGRPEQARRVFLASVCLLSAVLMPVFAAVAAIPDTVILAVYGQHWQSAIGLATPLALAMPVYAVLALGGPMMLGLGRAGMEAAAQGFGVLVLGVATFVAAQNSLADVAWAVLAVYLLRAILVTRLAMGLVSVDVSSLGRALAGPMLLGALTALFAGYANHLLADALPRPFIRLGADIVLAGTFVTATLLLLGRWIFCTEARSVLQQARSHLPPALNSLMAHWCGTCPDTSRRSMSGEG